MVSESSKKFHIIASRTTGTAEKNIINQENGICDIHKNAIYCGNGDKDFKLPHIKFEDKIIFILGYDNASNWKNALGGQYGCVLLDECNTADMEFVREISHRCEYMMGTLNPDDPRLPIYDEFVNRARPFKKYESDVPREIMDDLLRCEATKGYRYWFFTMDDNLAMTEEEKERKRNSVPKGTKMYKNKILGHRGKSTGLVFSNFDRSKHCISVEEAQKLKYIQFSSGCDTSYSSNSPDTIAMTYQGITEDGTLVILNERVYNNKDLDTPIAPSDTVANYHEFLDLNKDMYGFTRTGYIDSADQATIKEAAKYKRNHTCIYNFEGAWKKTKIIDRIILQLGWIDKGKYLVVDTCKHHIQELETYSWLEDKVDTPEDGNDHTINSNQYGWLPYVDKIGVEAPKTNAKDYSFVYDPRRGLRKR